MAASTLPGPNVAGASNAATGGGASERSATASSPAGSLRMGRVMPAFSCLRGRDAPNLRVRPDPQWSDPQWSGARWSGARQVCASVALTYHPARWACSRHRFPSRQVRAAATALVELSTGNVETRPRRDKARAWPREAVPRAALPRPRCTRSAAPRAATGPPCRARHRAGRAAGRRQGLRAIPKPSPRRKTRPIRCAAPFVPVPVRLC